MDEKIEKSLTGDPLRKNTSTSMSDVIMLVAVIATAIISLMTVLGNV